MDGGMVYALTIGATTLSRYETLPCAGSQVITASLITGQPGVPLVPEGGVHKIQPRAKSATVGESFERGALSCRKCMGMNDKDRTLYIRNLESIITRKILIIFIPLVLPTE